MPTNQDFIKQQLQPISQGAYSTFETLLNSYKMADCCIKGSVKGAFVECGVAAGAQVAAMQLACQHNNAERPFFLFDSYEGIPLAGKNDTSQPSIGAIPAHQLIETDLEKLLVSSGVTSHSLENVKNNFKQWGINDKNFIYVKGWFQHTIPNYTIMPDIAILRLDGDLYESTKVCLQHLFPKLVSGGILIIDDWELDGCRKACDEYFGRYKKLGKLQKIKNSTPVWFIKE